MPNQSKKLFRHLNKQTASLIVFVVLILSLGAFSSAQASSSGQNVNVTVSSTVPFHCADGIKNYTETGIDCGGVCAPCASHCANGIKDSDETGVDCGGNTCAVCGGGSGGGGGGGGGSNLGVNTILPIIFSGQAYPNSKVYLLRDAQLVTTTMADQNSNFQITFLSLPVGSSIFSAYSIDSSGQRSGLITFIVNITTGVVTNVSGIYIPPTIALNKSEVKKGDPILITGQTIPLADLIITVKSTNISIPVKSGADGWYRYSLDTANLDYGQHTAESKTIIAEQAGRYSQVVSFLVGDKNVLKPVGGGCGLHGDLNNDCRVNLVDFSIAAYWYKKKLSSNFGAIEQNALNDDNKINLTDFSIMAYYWTG